MAKKSGYLARQKVRDAIVQQETQDFSKQLFCDLYVINMRQNGVTEETCLNIIRAVEEDFGTFCDMWNDPKTKDKEKTEATGKLDRMLEHLCPNHFIPWDERYN